MLFAFQRWPDSLVCSQKLSQFLTVSTASFLLSGGSSRASPPLAEPTGTIDRVGPAIHFDHPSSVALDEVGSLVVIADTGNRRIRIFDAAGMPVHDFAHRVETPRGRVPGEPRGVAVDAAGTLFVIDALTTVVDVMDLLGNTIGRIDPHALDPDLPRDARPVAVAIDRDQHLVLAVGAKTSEIWGLDEKHEIAWWLTGAEEGQEPFGAVTALHVDFLGRLLVTDASGPTCVRVYDTKNTPVLAFGEHETGNENFSYPAAIVGTPDGRIWVADATRQTVKVFGSSGKLEGMLGGRGAGLGEFLYPTALATDGRQLYVLERVGSRLTTFRISGSTETTAEVSLVPEQR